MRYRSSKRPKKLHLKDDKMCDVALKLLSKDTYNRIDKMRSIGRQQNCYQLRTVVFNFLDLGTDDHKEQAGNSDRAQCDHRAHAIAVAHAEENHPGADD